MVLERCTVPTDRGAPEGAATALAGAERAACGIPVVSLWGHQRGLASAGIVARAGGQVTWRFVSVLPELLAGLVLR